jgi:hypothetical protein
MLWQRFLERFVPAMDDQPSHLDHLDGVGLGQSSASVRDASTRPSSGHSGAVPTPGQ